MRRLLPIFLALVLLLTGCSNWLDGSYNSITPHAAGNTTLDTGNITVRHYSELYTALQQMVENVATSGLLRASEYNEEYLTSDIQRAFETLRRENPVAAYALDEAHWELGTSGDQVAVSVNMTYTKAKAELLRIRKVSSESEYMAQVAKALDQCDSRLVLYMDWHSGSDYVQLVQDYATENPQIVMETPKVTLMSYPENGTRRIVEMTFTYENSRENLRYMRNHVNPVFRAAALNVSGDATPQEKYMLLYSFLMERHNYTVNTSITPAYSLIRYGEGDARAFATVYAAMCREAGLECKMVTGTRDGELWYWNLLFDGEGWHHLDLLQCSQDQGFCWHLDSEMVNYVWDYAQYPASVSIELPTPEVD